MHQIFTDGARNAIPGVVTIKGDTRSFDPDVQSLLERRMRQVCAGVSAAHGATCSVTYRHEFVPTVNDPACVAAAVAAATAAVGADRVDGACAPVLASEDFALLARQVPGCFTFIGNGVAQSGWRSAAQQRLRLQRRHHQHRRGVLRRAGPVGAGRE